MKTRALAKYPLSGADTRFLALLVLIVCAGLNAYAQQITGTIATGNEPDGLAWVSR